MALTVSTDIMKYRESTSDPWKNLIIEPSGTTMFFPNQTVNTASNAEIFRITDGAITTQTVVVECTFASPSSITSDVTWTSYDGYIAFYGTCTSATTADVALGNATVPTPETPLAIAKGGTGASNAADARLALGAGIQELWTNPASTQSFAPQTIQLAANDCDWFYVQFLQSTGDQTVFPGSSFFKPGETTAFMNPNGSSNGYVGNINLLVRRITASTQTSITFDKGYVIGAVPGDPRNDLGIPLRVLGFHV